MTIKSSKPFTILTLFMLFIASVPITEAQQRVNFKDKKLSELNTSWYPNVGRGGEEFPPTFPSIWSTFSAESDDFVFSGYYTVKGKNEEGLPIVNGPVRLERLRGDDEMGEYYKEVLTFNINSDWGAFESGNFGLNGTIEYTFFYQAGSEDEEASDNNAQWVPYITIRSSYINDEYQSVTYTQKMGDVDIYIITQQKSYTLDLAYFQTIINLNIAEAEYRPNFRIEKQ